MTADWQKDTCVAPKVDSMIKREFDGIEQAFNFLLSQFLDKRSEISELSEVHWVDGQMLKHPNLKNPKTPKW